MPNLGQMAILIGIALLFAWRGPVYPAWVLLANAIATLAVCLAMDLGSLVRSDATLAMMLVDFSAGVAMFLRPGLPRLLALGYAVTVPLYSANIIFGVSESTTFALVIAVGLLQIAVAGIGAGGNDSGGFRRSSAVFRPVASSGGNHPLGKGGLAQSRDNVSPDRRGR